MKAVKIILLLCLLNYTMPANSRIKLDFFGGKRYNFLKNQVPSANAFRFGGNGMREVGKYEDRSGGFGGKILFHLSA